MMKRLISLGLCLGMLAGTLLMAAGCETTTASSTTEDLPWTMNMVGITDKATDPTYVEYVEEALNKISKNNYKTKIELTLVTADEYIDLIEERAAQAEQNAVELAAIKKYNSLAQKEANKAQKLLSSTTKKTSKWTKKVSTVIASTISTGTVYTAEETTVYEDGKIETLYPDATSPIDILMIDGKEMYDYLDEKGYLLSIENKLETEFTKFRQFVYPTFFDQLKVITGDIKAIPNNNLLAEYTYLVVDKVIADKYEFNIENVDSYADLEEFLATVKEKETVAPMATEPEALGVYTYFEEESGIAVGTYCDPIYGYNIDEGTDFAVQNLFDIPQYREHVVLMEQYNANGYITEGAEEFAVTVVKGDASVAAEYGDDYYVKVIQNPFVEMDSIFDGMMAVSSYTADDSRALQIIEMFTTNSEAKNILQYGIEYDGDNAEYATYQVNEIKNDDGSVSLAIERLNNKYIMDNRLTGNVYMGYPEEGQTINAWTYYKQTNLDSSLSPFMNFYVGDSELDNMLDDILRRAALTEAFEPVGIDFDEYERSYGTPSGTALRVQFKSYYISYFMDLLDQENISNDPLNFITKGEGSEADAEFIRFAQSAEGQAIIRKTGYAAVDYNAPAYTKKDSLSGKIVICANVMSLGSPAGVISYLDTALTGLQKAFNEMYPDVEIVMPVKDSKDLYSTSLTTVGTSATIGITHRDLLANETSLGLESNKIGKSYFTVYNSSASQQIYNYAWYENKMIEKITAEKYADIISNTELNKMAKNKVASLAGIDLSRYKESNRPASESIVLANAKKSASDYYTNISYLRVMADKLLWEDLTLEEKAKYDAMKDVDFEQAVFNYVRDNYEKENNLTEEDYVKLVHDYMASFLEYASPEDKSTTYFVSWEEFEATKEAAQLYLEAATKVKDAYMDKLLRDTNQVILNLLSLDEIIERVYNIMYAEYLTENGLTKAEFELSVQDVYLKSVGTDAETFNSYAKTSDEYKNYVSKLRKKYKDILIDEYTLATYKSGEAGIPNDDVLETLFAYFLEEELAIYQKMADLAGVDVNDFISSEAQMANYDMYLSTLKTKFVYTLRTVYTQSQIDNWSYEEAEQNIFNVLYETGFYTNEMAKYIGLDLNDYMLSKSNAVSYQNYLKTLVNELSAEINARGYDVNEFLKEDGDLIEEVCAEIVLEKYYSDKVSLQDVLVSVSGEYMSGMNNADDVVAYFDEAAEAISSDYFFMAVVDALQATWEESKSAS